ncbi:preprotein translocase subunit YajC [Cardiobacterium valvarum]|uniref:Sec translocon accessory complex subunit YajC n=2 Tax=Cardiobacterium valvarum TaxID=194702 RepID=A0A381ED87_9GAMM|nr:preprotein translocase subunit YajC [Cardiobacterium valvarum]EHM49732.1 preprotein translocase, YajC subunit [Cardiobacterium valvarum F0432]SUX24900.1 preprotein translocase subunit YajC [Cardiobacterium valvarum]
MLFIQDAYAQAAPAAQPGGGLSIIMLVVLFGAMWFFMIRPQQKKMKEHQLLIGSLKKGDEVMTNGGLMGRVINLDNFAIDLEIAKNTVVRIQRGVVVQILPKGSLKASLGSNSAANDDKNEKDDKADEPKDDKEKE